MGSHVRLLAIVAAFFPLLLFVEEAPAVLSFVVTAGLAFAWCAWLDRHPGRG